VALAYFDLDLGSYLPTIQKKRVGFKLVSSRGLIFHFPFSNCHLLFSGGPQWKMINDNWKMENK
jgi:hypothetical protein